METGRERFRAGRLGSFGSRSERRAYLVEGLARVPGIELVDAADDDPIIWIRVHDRARTPEVARALSAENLPVVQRCDQVIGLPCDDWFRRADLMAVALCVTKVAHHLGLAG